ncbi:MAG: pyruvate kinase [Candidatus Moranbacteria bacterium CG_4_9_14_3_um_filter_42_9]|nr:MAG: pyruvate kinase [Candidatus Moranbacteria bacterium CG_4_9_14_3_um_filter_42_9]
MQSKRTKIVATLGPASESREILKKIIEAGVNVVRLNFSHGEHSWHGKIIDTVRELSAELGIPVGIMADLQGPRIRTLVDKDVEIRTGEKIIISDVSTDFKSKIQNPKSEKNSKFILLDYPGIIKDINEGNEILIEDGLKKLKVVKKEKEFLEAEVLNGGVIKNHKGINIPDANFHFGAVTAKDEHDLEFVLGKEVDFVALSFVSNAKEIEETQEKMKKLLGRDINIPQIIPKIERKEAIKNIDEIVAASDVVMVARGDLGIELPETEVAVHQKEIIGKCLAVGKPVIVATQMLDSMINNPIPTRAEVSDVTNAVIDHADAVMLSGESANGKYPVETVATMSEIISNTEKSPYDDAAPDYLDKNILTDYASTINSAHELAKSSGAKAIVMFSESGKTARLMAHHRPDQLLLVATNNPKTYHQLSIVWGIATYLFQIIDGRGRAIDLALEKAKKEERLAVGDKVVVILGKIPDGKELALVGIRTIE